MTSSNLSPEFRILEFGEDNLGKYLKVKVTIDKDTSMIRWGLDSYTYSSLQKIFLELPGYLNDKRYRLTMSRSFELDPAFGYITVLEIETNEFHLSKQFSCSELFASNLTWLRSIRHIGQLQTLEWNQSRKHNYKRKRSHTEQPRQDQPQKLRGWNKRVKWVSVICIIVILCTTGIFRFTTGSSEAQVSKSTYPELRNQSQTASVNIESKSVHKNISQAENVSASFNLERSDSTSVRDSQTVEGVEKYVYTDLSHVPVIYGVADGEVALTFDDGPSTYTNDIVSILNKYHVNGTFFFIGNRVSEWSDAVKNVLKQGNRVGNHSETHPLLTQLSNEGQKQQIIRGENDIQEYLQEKVTLFRPPYGEYNRVTENVLKDQHMVLAMWNRDPRDWSAKTSSQIVNAVINDHPSGGVIDLHEDQLTVAALPEVIEHLQQQGLKFVVLNAPSE